MGRALFFASAIASALLLFSCEKTQSSATPPATIADSKSCLVVVPDVTLWDISGTTLVPKGTVQIGEKLTLGGQTRRVAVNGNPRDFLRVRRDTGAEGWVRSDYVVSNAILAVTTSEVVIYAVPRNTAATTDTIPSMTVVAIHSDSGGMPFIHVSFFSPQQKPSVSEVYLRNEGVSARPDDVQAAILLQLAAESTSPKQQEAFLSSGIKDYPQSLFLPQLQQALAALHAPAQAAPPQAAAAAPATAGAAPAGGQAAAPSQPAAQSPAQPAAQSSPQAAGPAQAAPSQASAPAGQAGAPAAQ